MTMCAHLLNLKKCYICKNKVIVIGTPIAPPPTFLLTKQILHLFPSITHIVFIAQHLASLDIKSHFFVVLKPKIEMCVHIWYNKKGHVFFVGVH